MELHFCLTATKCGLLAFDITAMSAIDLLFKCIELRGRFGCSYGRMKLVLIYPHYIDGKPDQLVADMPRTALSDSDDAWDMFAATAWRKAAKFASDCGSGWI